MLDVYYNILRMYVKYLSNIIIRDSLSEAIIYSTTDGTNHLFMTSIKLMTYILVW